MKYICESRVMYRRYSILPEIFDITVVLCDNGLNYAKVDNDDGWIRVEAHPSDIWLYRYTIHPNIKEKLDQEYLQVLREEKLKRILE